MRRAFYDQGQASGKSGGPLPLRRSRTHAYWCSWTMKMASALFPEPQSGWVDRLCLWSGVWPKSNTNRWFGACIKGKASGEFCLTAACNNSKNPPCLRPWRCGWVWRYLPLRLSPGHASEASWWGTRLLIPSKNRAIGESLEISDGYWSHPMQRRAVQSRMQLQDAHASFPPVSISQITRMMLTSSKLWNAQPCELRREPAINNRYNMRFSGSPRSWCSVRGGGGGWAGTHARNADRDHAKNSVQATRHGNVQFRPTQHPWILYTSSSWPNSRQHKHFPIGNFSISRWILQAFTLRPIAKTTWSHYSSEFSG